MALPPAPTVAPLNSHSQREEHWRHFDDSVNAVSFGFVATAILISLFLVMGIFERFLQQRSSGRTGTRMDLDLEEQHIAFAEKLHHPSSKVTIDGRGILVLMPGEEMPTYIAHPAPAPCHPEPISWPLHHSWLNG
ncbi:hypothetical protein L6164_018742 [Bauhinia variegata]|uniref:Uncharacterized protein n=1 Tax=Bauhinia variegata TaxID=167791 RepID=A0ACB9NDW1_BAUVA|nr:hypothetical protein L6164_018742 [Bauhinia variegata]